MSEKQEIERVFLLRGMPVVRVTETVRIEQGYLPQEDRPGGRLRRTTSADGVCVHHRTMKRGTGLVRMEHEEEISAAEFSTAWPRTQGRRIAKVRHRVREGELVWEIDQFLEMSLVLAEVELPAADHAVAIPAWLSGLVEREVTEDGRYRNFMLAVQGAPSGPSCG